MEEGLEEFQEEVSARHVTVLGYARGSSVTPRQTAHSTKTKRPRLAGGGQMMGLAHRNGGVPCHSS